MSSVSLSQACPCCSFEGCEYYNDSRPFEHTVITCPNCGFFSRPVVDRMSKETCIDQMNASRDNDEDLPPLSPAEEKALMKNYDKFTKTFNEQFDGFIDKTGVYPRIAIQGIFNSDDLDNAREYCDENGVIFDYDGISGIMMFEGPQDVLDDIRKRHE